MTASCCEEFNSVRILIMVKKFVLAVLILLLLGGILSLGYVKSRFFSQAGSSEEKTNFLLLGVHGVGENLEDLTDTIIFTSINKEGKITLVSIPRDIWINEIQAKINTAYHYGGPDLIKKTIQDMLGQKVSYYLVVNFSGFEKAVDYLGGITIDVNRSFDDYLYPVAGKENDLCGGDKELKCRYEHLHFNSGPQFMDGETALKFVRSRNAEGEEGSDFARAQRQQLFLKAFIKKIASPEVYFYPQKLVNLYKIFREYTFTNIEENQYGGLLILFSKVRWDNLKTVVLNGDLLVHPQIHSSGQWVLVPKAKDWTEVQNFVKKTLN